jgi:hypothetical protein
MQGSLTRHTTSLILALLLISSSVQGDPITVRHPQGSAHGFLALKTLDGVRITTGDVTQMVRGALFAHRQQTKPLALASE